MMTRAGKLAGKTNRSLLAARLDQRVVLPTGSPTLRELARFKYEPCALVKNHQDGIAASISRPVTPRPRGRSGRRGASWWQPKRTGKVNHDRLGHPPPEPALRYPRPARSVQDGPVLQVWLTARPLTAQGDQDAKERMQAFLEAQTTAR
jgi:hypothetical protein